MKRQEKKGEERKERSNTEVFSKKKADKHSGFFVFVFRQRRVKKRGKEGEPVVDIKEHKAKQKQKSEYNDEAVINWGGQEVLKA